MELLPKAYDATAAVLVAVTDWDAPSPCAGWTVRQVHDHLIEAHHAFAAAIDGGPATGALDFAVATDRCLAALSRPGALEQEHPFPFGPTPGSVIAAISLSETLVHGWDIARGAGVAYAPPADVVAAVLASAADGPPPEAEGMFAPPVPVPPNASPLTTLLARLGRTA